MKQRLGIAPQCRIARNCLQVRGSCREWAFVRGNWSGTASERGINCLTRPRSALRGCPRCDRGADRLFVGCVLERCLLLAAKHLDLAAKARTCARASLRGDVFRNALIAHRILANRTASQPEKPASALGAACSSSHHAATNKCLAQNNKSLGGVSATKHRRSPYRHLTRRITQKENHDARIFYQQPARWTDRPPARCFAVDHARSL